MSDIEITTTASRIDAYCPTCGEGAEAPNKGLGRAIIAAWKSRHQHPAAPPAAPTDIKTRPGQADK